MESPRFRVATAATEPEPEPQADEPASQAARTRAQLQAMARVGRRSRLTPHHLFGAAARRRGSSESAVPSVVDVEVDQSSAQHARGVFSVLLHVRGPLGVEIVTVEDVPDGREARGTFLEQHHRPRHALLELVEPEAPPAPRPAFDPIEQLRRLGELRDAGIVSETEFATMKAEVLSRA